MSKPVIRSVQQSHRRQQLIPASHHSGQAVTRLGEAVGGAAAVFCCCPCGLANIMYLTMYKLPANLCRRALRKSSLRRRKIMDGEKRLPATRRRCAYEYYDDVSVRVYPTTFGGGDERMVDYESFVVEEDKEVVELEKEMWDKFYNSGFWRSWSHRDSSFSSALSSSQWVTVSIPNVKVVAV